MFKLETEVFKLAEVVFKLETEVFKLAEVDSKFVNLIKFEPLTTFNASILICWDADEVFNAATDVLTLALNDSILVNLPSCVSFVVLAADADAIKLPLTTPISVNLSFAEPVNAFKAVVDALDDVNEFNLL